MICYLFLKFLNAGISEKYLFSKGGDDSISVAKLRHFAQIVRLRNQYQEHCRRAVLRFKRRIGPWSGRLRRTSRRNRCSRRSPLFACRTFGSPAASRPGPRHNSATGLKRLGKWFRNHPNLIAHILEGVNRPAFDFARKTNNIKPSAVRMSLKRVKRTPLT
jgi:hypothetical protein